LKGLIIMTELNIKLGGAAGQGLQSAGFVLGKMFVRGGYHAFAVQDSMSRIRGGHNFYHLRIKSEPVAAMTAPVNILVALDNATVEIHRRELDDGGLLIVDKESLKVDVEGPDIVDLPMRKIAMETGGKPIFANSVAVGFITGLVGFGLDGLEQLFKENFKKGDLAKKNIDAAGAGYALAQSDFADRFGITLSPKAGPKRMFLNGNEAIALGAVAADCRFMSAYPMSPSTSIIMYLAKVEDKIGMVTEQAEDEIAAVNMAFGASMAGVRAMTATSGGGLALMSETISLSGAAEVPLVIVDCQRPGPGTGLPTRTDQSDLFFAIHTGHGEFTRAVLAPGNAEEAFYDTIKAFNLADKYQIPVIILAEQYLSDSFYTMDSPDLDAISLETSLLSDEAAAGLPEYKRYRITEDGISPRLYPGQSDHLVLTDNHEHDETGHITEDPTLRVRMVDKRAKRRALVAGRFTSPQIFGNQKANTMIVGWGTTREPLREALARLTDRGFDLGLAFYDELWPFPRENSVDALAGAKRLIIVEGNALSQLSELLARNLLRDDFETIRKYDGRPFLADELAEEIERVVNR